MRAAPALGRAKMLGGEKKGRARIEPLCFGLPVPAPARSAGSVCCHFRNYISFRQRPLLHRPQPDASSSTNQPCLLCCWERERTGLLWGFLLPAVWLPSSACFQNNALGQVGHHQATSRHAMTWIVFQRTKLNKVWEFAAVTSLCRFWPMFWRVFRVLNMWASTSRYSQNSWLYNHLHRQTLRNPSIINIILMQKILRHFQREKFSYV